MQQNLEVWTIHPLHYQDLNLTLRSCLTHPHTCTSGPSHTTKLYIAYNCIISTSNVPLHSAFPFVPKSSSLKEKYMFSTIYFLAVGCNFALE